MLRFLVAYSYNDRFRPIYLRKYEKQLLHRTVRSADRLQCGSDSVAHDYEAQLSELCPLMAVGRKTSGFRPETSTAGTRILLRISQRETLKGCLSNTARYNHFSDAISGNLDRQLTPHPRKTVPCSHLGRFTRGSASLTISSADSIREKTLASIPTYPKFQHHSLRCSCRQKTATVRFHEIESVRYTCIHLHVHGTSTDQRRYESPAHAAARALARFLPTRDRKCPHAMALVVCRLEGSVATW